MGTDVVSLPAVRGPQEGTVVLSVNGQERTLRIEPRVSLLDALRERLGLTGSKKGCDQGTCGACTVWVDDRRVLACLTLAVTCEGREVTTIEGLSADGTLHPMQAAFVDRDAFQCGYCTPGQIMSAVALIEEGHAGDDHASGRVRGPVEADGEEAPHVTASSLTARLGKRIGECRKHYKGKGVLHSAKWPGSFLLWEIAR